MLEVKVDRYLELRVRVAIVRANGSKLPNIEETDGDAEQVSFCITEIAEEFAGDVELALLTFGDGVRFGWH